MPQFELISQFTKDAFAAEDHYCRPRQIWVPCLQSTLCPLSNHTGHISVFAAASSSSASMSSAALQLSQTFPDPCTICKTVNAVQRKSTVNPPPVIAFGQGMHLPSMTHSTGGPDITILVSWEQPQNLVQGAHPSHSSGYSVNRTQYSHEHEHWAKFSYALPATETITFDISAVHEVGAWNKGHWVAIEEGKKDVDACIDASGLINIAFDTILPKILTFGAGFPWHIKEFVV
ncbi:hypothetical protein BDR07DRAFT_1477241 [Suillus spraguei]|nr:hypothetical protein BDR07DRAFT_1477241 [Suillus spraguei]